MLLRFQCDTFHVGVAQVSKNWFMMLFYLKLTLVMLINLQNSSYLLLTLVLVNIVSLFLSKKQFCMVSDFIFILYSISYKYPYFYVYRPTAKFLRTSELHRFQNGLPLLQSK